MHLSFLEMAWVTAMAAGGEQTRSAQARNVSLGARIPGYTRHKGRVGSAPRGRSDLPVGTPAPKDHDSWVSSPSAGSNVLDPSSKWLGLGSPLAYITNTTLGAADLNPLASRMLATIASRPNSPATVTTRPQALHIPAKSHPAFAPCG